MVKILQPSTGPHDPAIIGVDGQLRVLDRKSSRCKSYANGCRCSDCKAREHTKRSARKLGQSATPCACETPMRSSEGRCGNCGKAIRRAA